MRDADGKIRTTFCGSTDIVGTIKSENGNLRWDYCREHWKPSVTSYISMKMLAENLMMELLKKQFITDAELNKVLKEPDYVKAEVLKTLNSAKKLGVEKLKGKWIYFAIHEQDETFPAGSDVLNLKHNVDRVSFVRERTVKKAGVVWVAVNHKRYSIDKKGIVKFKKTTDKPIKIRYYSRCWE